MTDDSTNDKAMDAAALYRAHAPYLARFLMKLGATESNVGDLLQEVFLVAHRRGGYQPGPAKPTTWLSEIAVRVLSGARRTERRRPLHLDTEGVERSEASLSHPQTLGQPQPHAHPEAQLVARRSMSKLEQALSTLDTDQRAMLLLFELEGESCATLAETFGIPVGTVYSRIHTARQAVRLAYERAEHAPRQRRAQGDRP